MSTTYDIVCDNCRQKLWIGQRGSGNISPRVYTTPAHIRALEGFLIAHQNHHLMFGYDGGFPIEQQGVARGVDYQDFQVKDIPARLLASWSLTADELRELHEAIEY